MQLFNGEVVTELCACLPSNQERSIFVKYKYLNQCRHIKFFVTKLNKTQPWSWRSSVSLSAMGFFAHLVPGCSRISLLPSFSLFQLIFCFETTTPATDLKAQCKQKAASSHCLQLFGGLFLFFWDQIDPKYRYWCIYAGGKKSLNEGLAGRGTCHPPFLFGGLLPKPDNKFQSWYCWLWSAGFEVLQQ